MKISPFSSQSYAAAKNSTVGKPSFGSIFADATPQNRNIYGFYMQINPDFRKLKTSATRIFRELPTQVAVANLLNPDEKSEIKVLGCSDGSEAWAHAIVMKEVMGEKASKNIKIVGVVKADYLIELAKTDHIICSDIEKTLYVEREFDRSGLKSPVAGEGWNKYLIQSSRPKEYEMLCKKEPCLNYMEYDIASGKEIGHGIEWYKINKEGLPQVEFKTGDIRTSLDSDKDSKNVVYVIANTGAYLAEKDPNDFIKLFNDIKEKNRGKNVYVVLGDMENIMLNSSQQGMIDPNLQYLLNLFIKNMGYSSINKEQVKNLGLTNYEEVASKILKLN